ncbi:MAG: potassium channel family protein [Candidatus Binatia bacterium]
MRHYRGGLADWQESGGALEGGGPPASEPPLVVPLRRTPTAQGTRRQHWANVALMAIESWPTGPLLRLWLAMIVLCGVVYWLASVLPGQGLVANGTPVTRTLGGLGTAIYFSFVTAATVGYGDVVPMGAVRILAIAEAIAGLLAFGAVVSKFVSRRQDEIVREIHRVTFEERLDRVQTSLHLVLSELQVIATMCEEPTARPEAVMARLESGALVFAGELRAVHDLLYRPQQMPDEAVLEAILAGLAAALNQLAILLTCIPAAWSRSPTLDAARRRMARLAEEICGECVPRAYAPGLRIWMDRVQETARRIA